MNDCKHEPKKCPRCNSGFVCKVGDVANCQCNGISLTEEQEKFIGEKYRDCLCRNCLLELSKQMDFFKERFDVVHNR